MTVCLRADVRRLERPRKAWPAGPGIVLVDGAEERLAGNDVDIDPGFVVVPVDVPERSLRLFFLRDRILEGCELPLDLAVARLHVNLPRGRGGGGSGGWLFGLAPG